MSFNVNKLDVVFFQRDKNNTVYEQVNISGSSAIFFLDEKGILSAGALADILKAQGTTKAALKSYTRDVVLGETLYSVDTVNVGLPNRLVRYDADPNNPLAYKVTYTQTWTRDTPEGIGIGKSDDDPSVNATLDVSGTVIITGSLTVTGFIYGSASYALTASYVEGATFESSSYAVSSSYVYSSSYSDFALTASYVSGSIESSISSSYSLSSSYADFALTASYVSGSSDSSVSSSYADFALTASYISGSTESSISSSYSVSSSYVEFALTASHVDSSSYSLSSSYADFALTASYVSGSSDSSVSSSYSLSSSYADFALTASHVDSASYAADAFIPYDGNRPIKRGPYVGLNVGGDDLEEFIENFFFPFIPATLSINTSTLNYETGSQQTINLNGTIVANDETIFSTGSVMKTGGILVGTFGSTPYSVNDVNISRSYVYRSYFRVGYNGTPGNISSSTKTVNFNYPYLYGTSSTPNLTGTALYNALLKDYSSTSYTTNKTYNIVGVATYIYFAYPTGSKLISIKDPSNFEIYGSFEETGSSATTSSGLFSNWNNNYTIYRLRLPANPGGNFSFNFT